MNNKYLLLPLFTVLFSLGIGLYFSVNPVTGFRILGIQAEDGTAIQIFRPTSNRDFYYPQDCEDIPFDRCLLPNEKFYIYIDFLDYDDTPRNVTLNLYQLETTLVQFQDPETLEWITRNVTDYTKLVDNITLTMKKGQNEYGDTRYAIKKIDTTVWSALKPTDDKEYILIQYLDLSVDFWHRTNYGSIPVTLTNDQIYSYAYVQVAYFVVALIVGIVVGSILTAKVNRVYPAIPLSSIIIAGLLFFIVFLFNLVSQILSNSISGTEEEIFRQFAGVKPEFVSVSIAVLISLWIPSAFRNQALGKALVVKLNIPYENRKELFEKLINRDTNELRKKLKDVLPDGDWMELHFYTTWRGRKVYTHNPDSILSFITNLIWGGVKIAWESTTVVPAGGKDEKYKKNEIILTADFEEKSSVLLPKKYQDYINIALIVVSGVSFFLAFFIKELIWISIVFAFLLVFFFAYIHFEDQKSIIIDPLGRNASAAILDAMIVNDMEGDYDNTLIENVDLKRSHKFQVSIKENAARYESYVLVSSTIFQEDFAKNLPKYAEILESVGLKMDSQGNIDRKKKLKASRDESEDLDEYDDQIIGDNDQNINDGVNENE
ncbi:MAG: hypothetical protein HeimC3_47300 [Candidatus Heimdallarchaeota archaeon LC_3]|nr:MAG: hypothetical protein HeimC3_47300 [Candidatus Heimdallarchaeota archaeon LC_3]